MINKSKWCIKSRLENVKLSAIVICIGITEKKMIKNENKKVK